MSVTAWADESGEDNLADPAVDEEMEQPTLQAQAPAPAPVERAPDVDLSREQEMREMAARRRLNAVEQPDTRKLQEINERDEQHRKLSEHIRQLSTSKFTGHKGAWLYGDYKTIEKNSAPECAAECEADNECYHWNFLVEGVTCSLKRNSGGLNGDASNWVSGNASRYVPGVKTPPSQAAAATAAGDL